jgi:trimethylamine:corrinoid methyltransferase-like protein
MTRHHLSTILSPETTVVATPGQISSDLAGEAVILDLRSGVYYGLNEVGARIWHLVQHPHTIQAIQHAILEEYDVDSEACTQDISHLLQDLKAAGLVEMVDHHEASV